MDTGVVNLPPHTTLAAPPPTSAAAIEAARPEVFQLLMRTPAFLSLPEEERRRIAGDTVRVLSYMTDPNGVRSEVAAREASGDPSRSAASSLPATAPIARTLADDPVEATKRQLSQSPGFAGAQFDAGAVREGVEQFGELVRKVDFPKFVGGLIKNVFQAIVESSIEQMRAYGELIANVAKTTDQFMRDNIGEAAGRDYLADAYPDVLAVGTDTTADAFAEGEQGEQPDPRMTARGDNAAVRLAEISREMNVNPPVTDLSDADAELRLVTAARLQMAKSRQQLLSSMVMLGINRIVITDGSINAKVVFDMRASDKAKRNYTASMHDSEAQRYKQSIKAEYGSWYTPYSASAAFEGEQEHVATVGSAVDESSESRAEVKAKLSGDVRVNFKSDYLPLEKMATPEMMSVIQGNSTPYNPNGATTPARGTG
ncbi:hypothetical protein [Cellulomonas humilata]|uniref:Uncharacterized protein n=1 Tax=Cellulomonas humilata TaxID=144055 RepID=A0ABU0EF78_9CELL|nr:hypothetical protein [Cellulomonas humilata]MDQ0373921.1 hypothetical protein [Cellulomonas humilata]